MSAARDTQVDRSFDVIVVGGGIAGLYCARRLAARNLDVLVLEAGNRWGGRIETGQMKPAPFSGADLHKAEFGPMRFELNIQPLVKELLMQCNIESKAFSAPASPKPPVEYPLPADECGDCGTPLSALELLKLGVYRMLGEKPDVVTRSDGQPIVELDPEREKSLTKRTDENGGFDDLRKNARMPGAGHPLREQGFWNALYAQLSPMAVSKILHFGTFYHLMPDNPNAVEWAIFWLRLFRLKGKNAMNMIEAGVETLIDKLREDLEARGNVTLELNQAVIGLKPIGNSARVKIEVVDGGEWTADQVVLALPKEPLEKLAGEFPDEIREDLKSVIGFPLLKAFCVTDTPPWWATDPPTVQRGAWSVPTREIHYFPIKLKLRDPSPDHTLVLLYTDHPADAYWRLYLKEPNHHTEAEVNKSDALKNELASVLFNLHWDWAQSVRTIPDRTKHHAVSGPNGELILKALELYAALFESLDDRDPIWPEMGRKFPALVGFPAMILFRSRQLREWQRTAIGDCALRDWSLPPFGAGCHAWAPGAKSWEVRERLSAFGFAGQPGAQNLHVCGEAYSDYQGFIEGALRSAVDAADAI